MNAIIFILYIVGVFIAIDILDLIDKRMDEKERSREDESNN